MAFVLLIRACFIPIFYNYFLLIKEKCLTYYIFNFKNIKNIRNTVFLKRNDNLKTLFFIVFKNRNQTYS